MPEAKLEWKPDQYVAGQQLAYIRVDGETLLELAAWPSTPVPRREGGFGLYHHDGECLFATESPGLTLDQLKVAAEQLARETLTNALALLSAPTDEAANG